MAKRGRPPLARAVRVAFWEAVGAGVPVADAGVSAGAGRDTAKEWFRRAGGVRACGQPGPVSGRYLSL